MESSGILFQLFKEDLNEIIKNNLSEIFHKNWLNALNNTKVNQEILNSVCFFTDLLECGTLEVNQNYNFFLFIYFLFRLLLPFTLPSLN